MTTRATRVQRWERRIGTAVVAVAGGVGIALTPAAALSAHTETSAVAVAAGSEAVVSFEPEHGCGESATVGVRVQAPVADARAEAVDGWTATATPDDAGNTVLEWTGGRLPADEAGSFPVELVVPDAVGTLLAFPAVQRCENGEELAWIGVQPGDEFPAPQVLVLAAGSEPAATLDDVPADAPGRDLLVALATAASDDDDAAPPATTAAITSPAPTTATPATSTLPVATTAAVSTPSVAPATTTPSAPPSAPTTTTSAATVPTTTEGDGGGGSTGWVIAAVAAVVVIGGAVAAVYARRRGAAT